MVLIAIAIVYNPVTQWALAFEQLTPLDIHLIRSTPIWPSNSVCGL